MSIWIEIHCDVRKDGGNLDARCYSNRGENIGGLVDNTNASVLSAVAYLTMVAKKDGWVRTREGWCCPGCKEDGA